MGGCCRTPLWLYRQLEWTIVYVGVGKLNGTFDITNRKNSRKARVQFGKFSMVEEMTENAGEKFRQPDGKEWATLPKISRLRMKRQELKGGV